MSFMHNLWLNVRALWSLEARAQSIVEAQISSYQIAKRNLPDRDPNTWLAEALRSRTNWAGRPESHYFVFTAPYSVVDQQDEAPFAMGVHVLALEAGAKLHQVDSDLVKSLWDRFQSIMTPVYQMSKSEFLTKWEEINPYAASIAKDDLIEGIKATEDCTMEMELLLMNYPDLHGP